MCIILNTVSKFPRSHEKTVKCIYDGGKVEITLLLFTSRGRGSVLCDHPLVNVIKGIEWNGHVSYEPLLFYSNVHILGFNSTLSKPRSSMRSDSSEIERFRPV